MQVEAEELGLTVRYLGFDDRKLMVHADGAGVDELQELNKWASAFIDSSDDEVLEALPPFMLEVASPGVGNLIVTDRDFVLELADATRAYAWPAMEIGADPDMEMSWEMSLVWKQHVRKKEGSLARGG